MSHANPGDDRPNRRRLRLVSRGALKRLGVLGLIILTGGVWAYFAMFHMPGERHSGPLPPLTDDQRRLARELRRDVTHLASTIGPRNVYFPDAYDDAADWIEASLRDAGYEVQRLRYEAPHPDAAGRVRTFSNLVAEIPGDSARDEIVVLGAHYDTFHTSPGANDNATGVAALLAVARALRGSSPRRTVRLAFFANEEPPYFQTDGMGSLVLARQWRERGDDVVAMLSLETLGLYRDEPGSQRYPAPLGLLYPETGDFVAFVGNVGSRGLVKDVIGAFREETAFPSEGGAPPGFVPGVGWSDHWAFWQAGYRGVMITDTAPYRDSHYHTSGDTAERLDYERMARIVDGVMHVVDRLAGFVD